MNAHSDESRPSMGTMDAFRAFGVTMHQVEHNAAVYMTKAALGFHKPIEIEPGKAICVNCRKHPAWPCAEAQRLMSRLDELRAK